MEVKRNESVDNAMSDAEAILACLGPIACFVLHGERTARFAAELLVKSPAAADAIGDKVVNGMLEDSAAMLRKAREQMDALMQFMGDHFNNHDACSDTMTRVTAPVYDVLSKRRNGVSLDD